MDILCPNCAEPWDFDILHEEVDARWPDKPWLHKGDDDRQRQARYKKYYDEVRADFQSKGCEGLTCIGTKCSKKPDKQRAMAASAMYDLLGDDMDGAAAMLEDAEAMGIFDE